jgi:hypothetical protein
MRGVLRPAAVAASVSLCGCGLTVPEIQELPWDVQGGQQFVQAIVTNITCETQDALYYLYRDYKTTFMDDWGVQITLKLTIDEKGTANPTINWFPPSPVTSVFNLSAGGTLSSDATRIDILNSYYLVKDLNKAPCPPDIRGGAFILQSDLKLKEWLYDMVVAAGTNTVHFNKNKPGGPFKENVLSHEVKFEILSSGGITPTWKLTRVQINPTGTLLTLSRDRTQDLTITIGPADSTYVTDARGKIIKIGAAAPSRQAADIHLSNLIGSSVGQAVTSALRP